MKSPFSFAVLLMWLSLPLAALDYWRAWEQLPARMAIHFDFQWRANGWTSRAAAVELMVGLMLLLLITFTITLLLMRSAPHASFMPWLMLAFFYATIVFVCGVNHWVIRYNIAERTKTTLTEPM